MYLLFPYNSFSDFFFLFFVPVLVVVFPSFLNISIFLFFFLAVPSTFSSYLIGWYSWFRRGGILNAVTEFELQSRY